MQRVIYLDEICEGDAELHRHVDALFQSSHARGAILSGYVIASAGT